MKKLLTLTLLLTSVNAGAQSARLADQLPAGALLTLETHDAGGALDRFAGLLTSVMKNVGSPQESQGMLTDLGGMQQILKSSIGKEAVLGVFSVGAAQQTFEPQLLAVTRVDEFSSEFFRSMITKKPGAKVGLYPFVRQDGLFVGQARELVYLSSDKTLLMNYLARLSGKVAPRLNRSATYSVPMQATGPQELSLFFNFSGMAKLARTQLARVLLPRLLSPVVDALDTLGQYAAGFSTTPGGLTAQSAHAANPYGKDTPLYRILTHRSDFGVQALIPASAESVVARACAPEQNAYTARWLTRIDLFDPFGFLTDSQLASHLEQSSRYLGDECAQVSLAGGMAAAIDGSDPLKSFDYSVTYQKVSDMQAARAAMPEYAASLNQAIAALPKSLGALMKSANAASLQGLAEEGGMSALTFGAATSGLAQSMQQIDALLGRLKLVYAFKDGYLITAYSPAALAAALADNVARLADAADFQAANLNLGASAGWQYARAPQKVTSAQLMKLFTRNLPANSSSRDQQEMNSVFKPVASAASDLINRYGGMSSQSSVMNNLVTSQSSVVYRWGK
ncbi:hypothetical protein GCM10022631_37830 [Deinococcus rubellus]|uniref:DUF3352 domain-containing protein n=1 Tax=Deinococcus rubellus TaxID=1889240 RepID=A0ABY5YEB7_9DEIO|nr:hypothetical protein [Deinococcus rubellus]UWX63190.1 hypothetical protein N0D28_10545 [Deinococcus rubellus]